MLLYAKREYLIDPHGGKLVNRICEGHVREYLLDQTIPITLATAKDDAERFAIDKKIALCDKDGKMIGS